MIRMIMIMIMIMKLLLLIIIVILIIAPTAEQDGHVGGAAREARRGGRGEHVEGGQLALLGPNLHFVGCLLLMFVVAYLC